MRIVLDAMGTDDHPEPELQAAIAASQAWGDQVLLAGPEDVIAPELAMRGVSEGAVRVVDAPHVLEMTDKPAETARGDPDTSMAVAMDLVKHNEADAFVTCGNTGGALANAILRLGRMRGLKRPALAAIFPVRGGRAIVLDIGANTDCKPEYLVQFGVLGAVYAERVLGVGSPRVALLSNGEEQGKGNALVHAAHELLLASSLNYVGNLEPKEAYKAEAQVIVTDGFIGNVFLKTSEAVASFLVDTIRDEIRSSPLTGLGGLLARPAFRRVGRLLDPAEYGAGMLLGVNGLVFIGHGRFQSNGVFSAIRMARQAVHSQLTSAMAEAIQTRLA